MKVDAECRIDLFRFGTTVGELNTPRTPQPCKTYSF